MATIGPSSDLRNKYNEISAFCCLLVCPGLFYRRHGSDRLVVGLALLIAFPGLSIFLTRFITY